MSAAPSFRKATFLSPDDLKVAFLNLDEEGAL